jgi:hypothetical protein
MLEVLRLLHAHPMDGTEWFRRIRDNCFWEKSEPEPCERVIEEPERTLYHGVGDPAGRELVIGLAGASGNVNHSSPIILQKLDATRHDFLVLWDLSQKSYANGAAGARSFDELLDRVAEVAAPYRSLLVIGSSMAGGRSRSTPVAARRLLPKPSERSSLRVGWERQGLRWRRFPTGGSTIGSEISEASARMGRSRITVATTASSPTGIDPTGVPSASVKFATAWNVTAASRNPRRIIGGRSPSRTRTTPDRSDARVAQQVRDAEVRQNASDTAAPIRMNNERHTMNTTMA